MCSYETYSSPHNGSGKFSTVSLKTLTYLKGLEALIQVTLAPCFDDNARFATVPLKPLFDQ